MRTMGSLPLRIARFARSHDRWPCKKTMQISISLHGMPHKSCPPKILHSALRTMHSALCIPNDCRFTLFGHTTVLRFSLHKKRPAEKIRRRKHLIKSDKTNGASFAFAEHMRTVFLQTAPNSVRIALRFQTPFRCRSKLSQALRC